MGIGQPYIPPGPGRLAEAGNGLPRRDDRAAQREGRLMIGNVIGWIIFGLIAGAIAKFLHPGRDPGGIIVTIIIGIVGAVIGGFIGNALGFGGVNSWSLGSFILAVIGAIILLVIYGAVTRRA